MTPIQIDRAKTLTDALRFFSVLYKNVSRKEPDRTGLDLSVYGEHPWVRSVHLDAKTGRMILLEAEKIVRRELKLLGVQLQKKKSKRS